MSDYNFTLPGSGGSGVSFSVIGIDDISLFVQQKVIVVGSVGRLGPSVGHHIVPLRHSTLRDVHNHPMK